jgi:hypothetical protein
MMDGEWRLFIQVSRFELCHQVQMLDSDRGASKSAKGSEHQPIRASAESTPKTEKREPRNRETNKKQSSEKNANQ